MEHQITVTSPFIHSPNKDSHAKDNVLQVDLIQKGVKKLLQDPFEVGLDLRGRTIRLTLHEDGLAVTAELVPRPVFLKPGRNFSVSEDFDLITWTGEGGYGLSTD